MRDPGCVYRTGRYAVEPLTFFDMVYGRGPGHGEDGPFAAQ